MHLIFWKCADAASPKLSKPVHAIACQTWLVFLEKQCTTLQAMTPNGLAKNMYPNVGIMTVDASQSVHRTLHSVKYL